MENYDEVLTRWKEASPADVLEFNSIIHFRHLDRREIQRYAVVAAAVYAVEEWGTNFADLAEENERKHDEAHRAAGGPLGGVRGVQMPGFEIFHLGPRGPGAADDGGDTPQGGD